ncbi:LysM peptidoglycan-binding domain-containing protein [Arthrobacter bussei]|uniref:LysM peptidoglycan-binding domain-containing protein n=1 Tax=Arthrobacter bussei TaxID=2594179 RepID=A0A7X1NRT5_9MICC|nr:LysM peptidoglycan-binding domain-containing protein [Arthrobacter bussei]MPY11864.1 LysM peptidoglycan-binding domain-containing protein [Arthrobacter bussei]
MAEATVLHGSTALWALTPARAASHLRVVPSTFDADPARVRTSTQRTAGFSGSEGTVTDTSPAARPLTLTRRGRLLLVGLPIALGVAALVLLGAFLTSQAQAGVDAPAPSAVVQVDVAAGETLWDLAVQYAPERDTRQVVGEMVELNNLGTSVIHAGQSLSIPSRG